MVTPIKHLLGISQQSYFQSISHLPKLESPDLEARPNNIDMMVDYIQKNEPGGLVLLNSSGTLPLLRNGDYYGGVLPEVTVTRGYATGGHLYDGTSEPSQQMNNYPNSWWTNIG